LREIAYYELLENVFWGTQTSKEGDWYVGTKLRVVRLVFEPIDEIYYSPPQFVVGTSSTVDLLLMC